MGTQVDHGREPCPHRILDDLGGAFAMGACGGGLVHLVKGAYNSPRGYLVQGAVEAIKREAPRIGGYVFVFYDRESKCSGVFSCATRVFVRRVCVCVRVIVIDRDRYDDDFCILRWNDFLKSILARKMCDAYVLISLLIR